MSERQEQGSGPAWVPCLDCDEYWCRIHDEHVWECPCPGIEDGYLSAPYDEGGPPEHRTRTDD